MSQIIDPGKMMKAAATVQPVLPVLTPDMLRDWFAAAALTGMMSNSENLWTAGKVAEESAEAAYSFADAMMAARVKE